MERVEQLLRFWFWADATTRRDAREWFVADAAFDRACAAFLADHERAATGALDGWQAAPRSGLALILLLDQFPRNLFRGSARAFATDDKAVSVAQHAIAHQLDTALPPPERVFVYLPFEHSENIQDQDQGIRCFRALADEDAALSGHLRYAEQHRDIVRRFGRFPHRNAVLGRRSTPEEAAFLRRGETLA